MDDSNFKCVRCLGIVRPVDGRHHQKSFLVVGDELKVVAWFYYLRNVLSAGGDCELAKRTWVKHD